MTSSSDEPLRRLAVCRDRGGERLADTASEFDVLLTLARPPGKVRSADELSRPGAPPNRSSVTVRISNLRGKLSPSGRIIRTRRGSGYCLDPQALGDWTEHRTT